MFGINYTVRKSKIVKLVFWLVLLIVLVSGSEISFAQLAGTQFDTHPMHWARFWARGLFDRNLIYCPIWNLGNLADSGLSPSTPMKWCGSTTRT